MKLTLFNFCTIAAERILEENDPICPQILPISPSFVFCVAHERRHTSRRRLVWPFLGRAFSTCLERATAGQ